MGIEADLIEKERALLSFDARSSPEILRSLLSPEFLEIGASGDFFGLDSVLDSLPFESSWSAVSQDFEYRRLSSDLIQLFYRVVISRQSGLMKSYSRRTSIWRKEGMENDLQPRHSYFSF
ncbi:nuclear transport factor 2 family protein [Halomonas sp. SpR8]|nr:nuclear transport factor 2 family protein [Halomonas sp. SpR8]